MQNMTSKYSDIINKLWKAIDQFRGSIEIGSLKETVLLLLYLKYINDKSLSDYNDGSEITIPDESKWGNLQNAKEEVNYKIQTAIFELASKNPEFNEAIKRFSFDNNPLQPKLDRSLQNIIKIFSEYNFYSSDIEFGALFEGFLDRFNEKDFKGESALSNEIIELMRFFKPNKEDISVYNPFSRHGSFATAMPGIGSYLGQETNADVCAIAKLNLIIHGLGGNYSIENSDPIEYVNNPSMQDKYDFIVAAPPFRVRLNEKQIKHAQSQQKFLDSVVIEKSINLLNNKGKAAFLVAAGFLFNGGTEKLLRKRLVESDLVEMVIALPSRLLSNISLPVFLIVLNKNKSLRQIIKFIDASECFDKINKRLNRINLKEIYQLISIEESGAKIHFSNINEIVENDFNLTPLRYIPIENEVELFKNEAIVSLKQIIKPIPRKRNNNEHDKGKLIGIRDLSNDIKNLQKSFKELEVKELQRFAIPLPNNSLLLSTRFRDLKPTFYKNVKDDVYFNPGNITAFKVDETKVYIEFLLQELREEYVVFQISKYITGAAIPYISQKDLLNIKVKLPSIEKQREIVLKRLSALLNREDAEVKNKIKELELNRADENVYLRHHIAGPLGNIRKSFNSLNDIIDNQLLNKVDGLMEMKVKPSSNLTFGKYIKIIQRDLKSISDSVDKTKFENIEQSNKDVIDIVNFLNNYLTELTEKVEGKYNIVNKLDWLKNEMKLANLTIYVEGDISLLRKMLDNLFENAVKHAFSNSNYLHHEFSIEAIWHSEDSGIHPDHIEKQGIFIDVRNTCESLPSNFSTETYKRKGGIAGKNAGDGYGGWFVNEVVKEFNGYDLCISEDGSIDEYETDSGIHVINEFEVSWVFPIKIEYNG